MSKRIIWVDIAKFIGIFLVIFCHTIGKMGMGDCGVRIFIHLFFMQLFFFLAGFMYKHKTLKENLKKILWSLLVPYLIYQFAYLPLILGNHVLYHHLAFWPELLRGLCGIIVVGNGPVKDTWYYIICGPLWFIVSLMEIRLLFAFIKPNKITLITISTICIILVKILICSHIDLQCCIDNTLLALPYFALGYLIKDIFPNFKNDINNTKMNILKSFLIISIYFVLLYLVLKYNGFARMSDAIPSLYKVKSLFFMYFAGVIGTLMVIQFCKHIHSENFFVSTISQNTLFILFYHWFILFFVQWAKINECFFFNNSSYWIQIIYCLIFSIINLIICFVTILLLKRFPLIFGKYNYKKLEVKNADE